MFKAASAAVGSDPVRVAEPVPSELIPLSVLALDLDPGEPWHVFLGRRGIRFVSDHIGRDAVSVGDAQRLIAEQREHEVRTAKHLKLVEAEAIERDRQFRASLPRGLPVSAFAGDATYGELVAAAELAGVPKRLSPLEESLSGESGTFHSLQGEAAS